MQADRLALWLESSLIAAQRQGLAVPRAGDRSYMTGSIRGWSRLHLTYTVLRVAADAKSASSLRSLPNY